MLFLLATLQAAPPPACPDPQALDVVRRAAAVNRMAPAGLSGYSARVESEVAWMARQDQGVEGASSVEQVKSTIRWTRTAPFEQEILAVRNLATGLPIPVGEALRMNWVTPVLTGRHFAVPAEEVLLGDEPPGGPQAPFVPSRLLTDVLHPLAGDSAQAVYCYTVDSLLDSGRYALDVEPAPGMQHESSRFRGRLELDTGTLEIVRVFGALISAEEANGGAPGFLGGRLSTFTFVDYRAVPVEGHWLPAEERYEIHVTSPLTATGRTIIRAISRFSDHVLEPAASQPDVLTDMSTQWFRLRDLTGQEGPAPANAWIAVTGEPSSSVQAADFDPVSRPDWQATGPPDFDLRAEFGREFMRFNRIEGLFVGGAATWRMRNAWPGAVFHANAGLAFAEEAVRGSLRFRRDVNGYFYGVEGGRWLDHTNDFTGPFDLGPGLSTLIEQDNYDYVDRSRGLVTGGLTWGGLRGSELRVEAGLGDDGIVTASRERSPLGVEYRPNRGIDAGHYSFANVRLLLNPDVSATWVRPGVGASLRYEGATGDLAWQRIEARVTARGNWRPVLFTFLADGGILTGDSLPPQQLFEIGDRQGLPGYEYKEFAGNQSIVVRTAAQLSLGLLDRPIPISHRIAFPAIAPALYLAVQAGGTRATTDAALSAIGRLGTMPDPETGEPIPVSRPSDGLRATVDVRMIFFGGFFSLGFARPIDQQAPWKFIAQLGRPL